jgi:hypothetical protein
VHGFPQQGHQQSASPRVRKSNAVLQRAAIIFTRSTPILRDFMATSFARWEAAMPRPINLVMFP